MSEFELTTAVNEIDSRLRKTKRFQRTMVGFGFVAGATTGILVAHKAPDTVTTPVFYSPIAASAAAILERRQAINSCQGVVIKFAESQGKDARLTQSVKTRLIADSQGSIFKHVVRDPSTEELWGSNLISYLSGGITPTSMSLGVGLTASQLPPGNFNAIATGLSVAALVGTTIFQCATEQSVQDLLGVLPEQLANIDGALPEL